MPFLSRLAVVTLGASVIEFIHLLFTQFIVWKLGQWWCPLLGVSVRVEELNGVVPVAHTERLADNRS